MNYYCVRLNIFVILEVFKKYWRQSVPMPINLRLCKSECVRHLADRLSLILFRVQDQALKDNSFITPFKIQSLYEFLVT